MADTKKVIGKVSLTPKGSYDPAVTYDRLDVIRYDGCGYIVLADSIHGVTPVDGDHYMLLADKGDKGDTGDAGPQGEHGPKGDPGDPYTLPIAGPSQLGGVQPEAKTDAMTQAVGVDASGALFTAPGANGKSAYQYAQDGGYTGTEAEFAAKLAAEKFVNPNALTFTGAVTGSYDGSAAVTVEIPSGGGAAEREWTMLGEIDISAVGGGNIELTDLDNFTEFYATWETVINESTTASGYGLYINDILIASGAIPILKTGSSASYGWMIARYNGLVWEFQRSNGAVLNSNNTLNATNGMFPYNLFLDVGKATEFTLVPPVPAYQAVSGIITIYGR